MIGHVETEGVCENAIANTTAAIVSSNSPNVDATTGATFTSRWAIGSGRISGENAAENANAVSSQKSRSTDE